jgi:predicted RNase H-like nuclease (RuvC/YqgF family)
MSNLDETVNELKEVNKHLSTISALLQQKDQKLDESLNVIRKDLWNIKNIISEEIAQNKNLHNGLEKTIENTIGKTLFKSMAYIVASGIMLYIVGKFLL